MPLLARRASSSTSGERRARQQHSAVRCLADTHDQHTHARTHRAGRAIPEQPPRPSPGLVSSLRRCSTPTGCSTAGCRRSCAANHSSACIVPPTLPRPAAQAETRGIGWDAGLGGFIAAAITGAYAGAAVVWANYSSPRFRKAFGVSGKLAMVVTPAFFAFLLKSHLVVAYAIADNRKRAAARSAATIACSSHSDSPASSRRYIAPLSDQR